MRHVGPRSALIVDDDPDIRALISTVLQLATAFDCYEARDGDHALESWRIHHQDLIVLDQMMPGRTGLDVAEDILEISPDQPVVIFSAYVDRAMIEEARNIGVRAVLTKEEFAKLVDILQAADR